MKSGRINITSLFLALASLISISKPSLAQIRNQVAIGTRPLSMGEAFVAVADDGNAIYWNPAGLARMERIQMSFAYADLFGLGIKSFYGSFLSRLYPIPALTDYVAAGVDWSVIKFGDDELEYDQNQWNFSLAFRPPQSVPVLRDFSLGANAKYLKLGGKLDGHLEADASGWGWDAGMLYNLGGLFSAPKKINSRQRETKPQSDSLQNSKRGIFHHILDALRSVPPKITLGLMVHDVGGTKIKHETGRKDKLHFENIRWGLSYRPIEAWPGGKIPISDPVLAIDFDDRIHIGLEFWLARTLALRAGLQKDFHTDESATFSFGVGFKTNPKKGSAVSVDYALTDSPVLSNTNKQFGGSLILKENPRLIRIEDAAINDIFASLYKHYAYEAGDRVSASKIDSSKAGELGRVVLENLHDDSLTVEVTFNAEPYTKHPLPQTVVVPAKGIKEVSLRAFLNESIITAKARERKTAKIVATYSLPSRGEFDTPLSVGYTLYGPGFLTWDDPGKAAAFVTKNDRCLNEFAKSVVTQDLPDKSGGNFFSRNMDYALKVYEALNALHYRWVKDAKTPFHQVGQTKHVVDQIRYPADLLASTPAGDCDDLAVLYASLLESIGVETVLLATPTHLFMMLNTDIPERRSNSMLVSPKKFFPYRGTLWLPVETTVFPASFTEAWHLGAVKAGEAFEGDSLQIVDIAFGRYEPADIHFACQTEAPSIGAIATSSLAALADTVNAYLRKFENDLRRNPSDIERRNEYAAVLGQNGERQKARTQLKMVLAQNPKHASGLNNRGNLEFVEGNYAVAESLYYGAIRNNPYNKAGTYLNLAFLFAMQITDDTERSEALRQDCINSLKEASRWLNNDPEQAALMLGLSPVLPLGKGGQHEAEKQKPAALGAARLDSSGVVQDTTRYTPTDDSGLLKKLLGIGRFINNTMQGLLEGREPDDFMPGWAGPKGEGLVDEDRARLLWWEI